MLSSQWRPATFTQPLPSSVAYTSWTVYSLPGDTTAVFLLLLISYMTRQPSPNPSTRFPSADTPSQQRRETPSRHNKEKVQTPYEAPPPSRHTTITCGFSDPPASATPRFLSRAPASHRTPAVYAHLQHQTRPQGRPANDGSPWSKAKRA